MVGTRLHGAHWKNKKYKTVSTQKRALGKLGACFLLFALRKLSYVLVCVYAQIYVSFVSWFADVVCIGGRCGIYQL